MQPQVIQRAGASLYPPAVGRPQKFETRPRWGATLSFVDNTGLSRGQAVKCFVFRFESSLGLKRRRRIMRPIGLDGSLGVEPPFQSEYSWCGWPHLRWTSTNEWIDDTHASVHEISTISRGNRQTVDERRGRDEAILDWHGCPGCAKTRQQFRPFQPGLRVPGETVENPDPRVEPTFQSGPLPS